MSPTYGAQRICKHVSIDILHENIPNNAVEIFPGNFNCLERQKCVKNTLT